MVSREYEGLAGVGGVKDVCRQSAEAFSRSGLRATVVMPCYGFIEPQAHGFKGRVAKPYRLEDLIAVLNRVLDS